MFLKFLQILQESLFNKVAVLRASNFIKKASDTSAFSVRFAKFLNTTILKNICERLLPNLFKNELQHSCFPVNLVNNSITTILRALTNGWF